MLLFLNSDTEILDHNVNKIVDFLDRHPEVGIATGRVLNKDGSFQRPFRRFPWILGAYIRHTFHLIYNFKTRKNSYFANFIVLAILILAIFSFTHIWHWTHEFRMPQTGVLVHILWGYTL